MDQSNPGYAKIMSYIDSNPAAVLSTASPDGPHGAVVYVMTASHGTICFVTKTGSQKYSNILSQPTVSLTFFNEKDSSTLQTSGKAFVADDSQDLKDQVLNKMKQNHALLPGWMPPVTKLVNGEYVVIGVELKTARLTEFGGSGFGGPTYTEL